MEKKYIYFQPQYVSEFICDSSKCNDNCCERNWNIDVDAETYEKYLQLVPAIANQFEFNARKKKYLLTKHPCPFLTEKKLCRLQLKYGEDFLSSTCRSYPRVTNYFGKFFERSLTLTCPVAAERILFQKEPMNFELVEVSEEVHANKGIKVNLVNLDEKFLPHVIEIQIAMISILQEQMFTIDQRLIVLGFFLDRLDEILSAETFEAANLTKLIEAYESKNFWTEQVPRMIRSIFFDAKRFSAIMIELSIKFFGKGSFSDAISKVTSDKKLLTNFRKNFRDRHATLFKNFLVNELFINCYPWRVENNIIKNFGIFVIKYKIFELVILLATLKNSIDKEEIILLTERFTSKFDHIEINQQQIFEYLQDKDDTLELMNSLLEGD